MLTVVALIGCSSLRGVLLPGHGILDLVHQTRHDCRFGWVSLVCLVVG